MTPEFHSHRTRIAQAREHTHSLLEEISPGHARAKETLQGAWELVFDLLCTLDTPPDIGEVNTLSGIIQKLMGSNTHIRTLELKVREDERKEEEFLNKKQQLEATLAQARENTEGITPETLADIEHQLKLL